MAHKVMARRHCICHDVAPSLGDAVALRRNAGASPSDAMGGSPPTGSPPRVTFFALVEPFASQHHDITTISFFSNLKIESSSS